MFEVGGNTCNNVARITISMNKSQEYCIEEEMDLPRDTTLQHIPDTPSTRKQVGEFWRAAGQASLSFPSHFFPIPRSLKHAGTQLESGI